MRHGLDFVDLPNPKVRRPTVCLEQRIMIGTEMSRCAPTMNGGVEHAAEVGANDRTAVHADSDEATRELVPRSAAAIGARCATWLNRRKVLNARRRAVSGSSRLNFPFFSD